MADRFTEPLIDALRHVHVFEDLDEAGRRWLAERMDDVTFEDDTVVFTAGEPADRMVALLTGEIHVVRPDTNEPFLFVHEGEVSGVLPYSRMTTLLASARVVTRSRVATLHREHFPDLLRELPTVGERLVWMMADRIREQAVNETHREKLMALGKLSAGLAHELNNPASAVQRAASQLCSVLTDLQGLDTTGPCAALAERLASAQPATDPLERSDRERALRQWSRSAGLDVPRDALAALADAGISAEDVAGFTEGLAPDVIAALLVRTTMAWRARVLVDDIEHGTARIAHLVGAIKDYAYRDQAPMQSVDVKSSLERTLIVFTPRLKRDVVVERALADALPPVDGNASELTQIWTNLIENALDAMQDHGVLRVSARREGPMVVVEIGDSGPGIPKDIERKVFEPFFTTKPQGEGTGLGLDIVRGIARRHRGTVRVLRSAPGDTVLEVRLPVSTAQEGEKTDGHHVQTS